MGGNRRAISGAVREDPRGNADDRVHTELASIGMDESVVYGQPQKKEHNHEGENRQGIEKDPVDLAWATSCTV